MAKIGKKQHFWTYLPELGQEWSYCDRCDKCRMLFPETEAEKGLFTYNQALAMVKADPDRFQPEER